MASMVIAVPTGIKVFSWLATMWGGSIEFKTPMLFARRRHGRGAGQCRGRRRAARHLLHVVAHFHYVMSLGSLFGMFAGFYYWIGKMSGRRYPETLGRIHFWLIFIGVNLAFFPMHFLGLAGMPRRIPDYPEAFAGWNLVSSLGSFLSFAGTLVFILVVYRTLTAGARCPANPWGRGRHDPGMASALAAAVPQLAGAAGHGRRASRPAAPEPGGRMRSRRARDRRRRARPRRRRAQSSECPLEGEPRCPAAATRCPERKRSPGAA
jgi:heme/copper-type cytochrome/quinol oxidase subunit 1